MTTGEKIAKARKQKGWTQEQLAEKMEVTFQAVSQWERDESIPDARRLWDLSRALDTSMDHLMSPGRPDFEQREKIFDEDHMYTFLKAKAHALGLNQTLKALPFAKEKHYGQKRKGPAKIPYISHPLTMACHTLAMGITDDDVVAAMLLHDIVEDTGTALNDLPAGERVKEAVRLVSYNSYPAPKQLIKDEYYANIAKNPLACFVKCVDRCCNLSGMASGFTEKKMADYVVETEARILPLLNVVRNVPEWNNAAWLLRYQMCSLLETFKRFL